MPIVDIEIVGNLPAAEVATLAPVLADTIGATLAAPPGRTWVRMRLLAPDAYAENGGAPGGDLPVFVTITRRELPAELAAEATAVCAVVAAATGRARDRVHVEYAPPAAGRIAFGGVLAD